MPTFEEFWERFTQLQPDVSFRKVERTVAEVFWTACAESLNTESLNTELAAKDRTITDLQAQLSKSREDLEHADQLIREAKAEERAAMTTEIQAERAAVLESVAGHIPITRSAGPDDPDWLISKGACSCGQLVADGVTLWNKLWSDHIRALITPTDRSTLDRYVEKKVREGRLAEVELIHDRYWSKNLLRHHCICDPNFWLCQRLAELRASLPAASPKEKRDAR
jgi:multidrug efflux pump subunit AcrA (membrane-fusion protein)